MTPYRTRLVPEMALTRADEAGIAALLERSFTDSDFGGRSYYKQRHHLRLLAEAQDGEVIAHMAVCLRAVRLQGRLVDIAGLAEVATHPDHRGQGIAGALLAQAIATARAGPAEFVVLFGDRPLYAASGFVAQPDNPMRWVGMDGAATGRICEGQGDNLRVLPLRNTAWDGRAMLDLMGPLF